MKKRLKINGILIFIAAVLLVFFPKVFFRVSGREFPEAIIESCGLALIMLGQLIRVSARGFKAEHSQQGEALIDNGPYALVRNPMYLGILLIGIGIVMMLLNWWLALVFALIFFVRYILLIDKEEHKLTALFKEHYLNYKNKVPRLLPSLGMLLNSEFTEYLPLKFSWLKKEIGTIAVVLFIALFLESWEDISKNGIVMYVQEALIMLTMFLLFLLLSAYIIKRTNVIEKNGSNKNQDN